MAGELLTIKQIAKQLGVAASTLKYWRDKFPEYMPTVDGGRYPKYRPEAIEIFKIIRDGINDNLQQQDIAARLSREFGLNIEDNKSGKSAAAAATVQQQQSIGFMMAVYDARVTELKQHNEELKTDIEFLKNQLDDKKSDINFLKDELIYKDAALMKTQAQLDRALLPWWRRWR